MELQKSNTHTHTHARKGLFFLLIQHFRVFDAAALQSCGVLCDGLASGGVCEAWLLSNNLCNLKVLVLALLECFLNAHNVARHAFVLFIVHKED